MDYSLLVGLHFCDDGLPSNLDISPSSRTSPAMWMSESEDGSENIGRKAAVRLGLNMPARAELIWRNESLVAQGREGDVYEVMLYFGIIDILQDYDISKKLEHAYKSLQVDPISISAVDPKLYSRRFRDFIQRIFVIDR